MKVTDLQGKLPIGELGEPLHYYDAIGSTNDLAKQMAGEGAGHGTLVLADEQTAGRGRWQRSWHTPAGSALALSLVLRLPALNPNRVPALNVLGALAVSQALEEYGAEPEIKWPNDVLLSGEKVAGILVEAGWQEGSLDYVVIGIGVNVLPESVPPPEELTFPATSVQQAVEVPIRRQELLLNILQQLDSWLSHVNSGELLEAWNQRLAYKGQQVQVEGREDQIQGRLLEVAADGRLVLEVDGQRRTAGEDFVHLRQVDRNSG
ncbi:MAG: biotin--[acetyl-CoA-carboxylase] ligase [Anaerolineales bacterium]